MASTIDENGFHKKRYQDLRLDIATDWVDYGLPDVSDNTTSIAGRMVSQQANLQERTESLIQSVAESFNPYVATGEQLSRLAPVMGKKRNKKSYSTVVITITADGNGASIPSSKVFQISNPADSAVKFGVVNAIQIQPNSSISVIAEAINYGPISADVGEITKINTPLFGVLSVTNDAKASVGTNRETDTNLRFRMLRTSAQDSTTLYGAFSAISDIDGVTYASIHDKSSPKAVELGIQDGEVLFIIDGGNDEEIADTMMRKCVSGGIITKDDVSGATITSVSVVNPANNQPVIYNIVRPSDQLIYAKLLVSPEAGVAPDYIARIKQSIVDYISALDVGAKVMASRIASAAQCDTDGFDVLSSFVGTSTSPTDLFIQLSPFQRASITIDNIEVLVS